MPRAPRLAITDLPIHVVQRGHNRGRCFFTERDCGAYLDVLRDAAEVAAVAVHAYALMTNHVHLLVTPRVAHGVSRMLHAMGTRYVRYVNDAQGRRGTLWEGRHRQSPVETDGHLLAACRYIDLNPVRAGIVAHPADYPWSSYRTLAGRVRQPWLKPHPALAIIGAVPGPAYAAWCARGIADDELAAIRESTRRQRPFTDAVAKPLPAAA
jgi:putative transposase